MLNPLTIVNAGGTDETPVSGLIPVYDLPDNVNQNKF